MLNRITKSRNETLKNAVFPWDCPVSHTSCAPQQKEVTSLRSLMAGGHWEVNFQSERVRKISCPSKNLRKPGSGCRILCPVRNASKLPKKIYFIQSVTKPISCNLTSNISNTRECFIRFPNTEKRVENTTRSGVFLTNYEEFVNLMKHSLECLIYLLNRNWNYGENGDIKS